MGNKKLVHVLSYNILGTLFWDDITIFWDENYVNKLLIGPKQVFFSVINHKKISSQNKVPKFCGFLRIYEL